MRELASHSYAVDDVESLLSDGVVAHLDGHPDGLRGCVRALAGSELLETLLREILVEQDRLAAVAAQSYVHDNGFSKIVLASSKQPAYKLRLHVWWPQPARGSGEPCVENIHNHRWDFATTILAGGYEFDEFRRCDDGLEKFEYEYFSPESGSRYTIVERGRSHVRGVFAGSLRAGDSYVLAADVMHRVISMPDELSATLVLQGPVVRTSTNVFADAPLAQADDVPVSYLSEEELARTLRRCLELV